MRQNSYYNKDIDILYRLINTSNKYQTIYNYLIVGNFLIDFCEQHNISNYILLDRYGVISGSSFSFFDAFLLEIIGTKDRLNELLLFLNHFIEIFVIDSLQFELFTLSKLYVLFRLHRYIEAENLLNDYLVDNPTWGIGYITIIDYYVFLAHNENRAKHYFEIAKNIDNLEGKDALLQRKYYFVPSA